MKHTVIVGAGINGLVAANYLQRSGFAVTLLERGPTVGGACSSKVHSIRGRDCVYSSGATVLGLMQDFVFQDTGLANELSLFAPQHPPVVYFSSQTEPCHFHSETTSLATELKIKWVETGNVAGFLKDRDTVRQFLIDGFKKATAPTISQAERILGQELTQLWITGSARELLNHYFVSEKTKIFFAIDVIESGPVPLNSPYSAFNIALMSTGSVFDGDWGFVSGGIWNIAASLARINASLGAKTITSATLTGISTQNSSVEYTINGGDRREQADLIVFATDPVTAAEAIGDPDLRHLVAGKKMLGTSGKLVMFFTNPVRWQDSTGEQDFESAFRFVISSETLTEFETSSESVQTLKQDFSPAFCEIYCEGAALRKLGIKQDYETVAVFFKNLSFAKNGHQLPKVQRQVEELILSKIENRDDFIESILITPRDIRETFFMPEGNIDHIELCDGQNFFQRTFSADPLNSFYQFGKHRNIYYCGAGSYPCGSVAGTPGYMCAQQIIQNYA